MLEARAVSRKKHKARTKEKACPYLNLKLTGVLATYGSDGPPSAGEGALMTKQRMVKTSPPNIWSEENFAAKRKRSIEKPQGQKPNRPVIAVRESRTRSREKKEKRLTSPL